MAKVGNIELRVNTEFKQKYPLFYTSSKKFEVKGIADEFYKITGIRSCGYNTEVELENTFIRASIEYNKQKTSSRLVIAYYCSASTQIKMNQTGAGSWQGNINGISRKIKGFNYSVPSCTIGIDFGVYMEINDGKLTYKTVGSDLKVSSSNDVYLNDKTIIEYTEERYNCFLQMKQGMTQMLKQLSMFFDLDQEQAENLLDSGSGIKMLK